MARWKKKINKESLDPFEGQWQLNPLRITTAEECNAQASRCLRWNLVARGMSENWALVITTTAFTFCVSCPKALRTGFIFVEEFTFPGHHTFSAANPTSSNTITFAVCAFFNSANSCCTRSSHCHGQYDCQNNGQDGSGVGHWTLSNEADELRSCRGLEQANSPW